MCVILGVQMARSWRRPLGWDLSLCGFVHRVFGGYLCLVFLGGLRGTVGGLVVTVGLCGVPLRVLSEVGCGLAVSYFSGCFEKTFF